MWRRNNWCQLWDSPWSMTLRQFVSFWGFDGSSEMWLWSFCILRRPFSALHTPSLDFIALPVHSGSKHLILLKHCVKHFFFISNNRTQHPGAWTNNYLHQFVVTLRDFVTSWFSKGTGLNCADGLHSKDIPYWWMPSKGIHSHSREVLSSKLE